MGTYLFGGHHSSHDSSQSFFRREGEKGVLFSLLALNGDLFLNMRMAQLVLFNEDDQFASFKILSSIWIHFRSKQDKDSQSVVKIKAGLYS